jgi:hypothetical protein
MLERQRGLIDEGIEPQRGAVGDDVEQERQRSFDALLAEYGIGPEGGTPYDEMIGSGGWQREARVLDRVPKNTLPASEEGGKMRRWAVDSLDEVRRLENAIKGKGVNIDIYAWLNNVRAAQGIVPRMMENWQVDFNGKVVGPALNEVWRPIEARGKEFKRAMEDYLLEMLNVDRMEYRKNRAVYDGVSEQDLIDMDVPASKPVRHPDVTADVSRARVAELLSKYPWLPELAGPIWQFNDNNLSYQVQAGMIDPDLAERMRALNPHYVPLMRNYVEASKPLGKKNREIVAGRSLKGAEGGTENILPLKEAMARRTYSVVKQAAFNTGVQKLDEVAAGKYPQAQRFVRVSDAEVLRRKSQAAIDAANEKLPPERSMAELDLMRSGLEAGAGESAISSKVGRGERLQGLPNTVKFWRDGSLTELQVNDGIADGLKSLRGQDFDSNLILRGLAKGTDLMKKTITGYNPLFSLRNYITNWSEELTFTRNRMDIYLKARASAARDMAFNSPVYQLYANMGAGALRAFDYESGSMNTMKGRAQNAGGLAKPFLQAARPAAAVLRQFERLNTAIEHLPRYAEFKATLMSGGADLKNPGAIDSNLKARALYNANEIVTNFGRGGTGGKFLNRHGVMYLNPAIQGVDKLYRAMKGEYGKSAQAKATIKAIIGLWVKLALVNIVPAIANELMHKDDDDYRDLPDRVKDRNYLFKMPDGTFILILLLIQCCPLLPTAPTVAFSPGGLLRIRP